MVGTGNGHPISYLIAIFGRRRKKEERASHIKCDGRALLRSGQRLIDQLQSKLQDARFEGGRNLSAAGGIAARDLR
jgi:hypothetical protein